MRNTVTKSPYAIRKTTGTLFLYGQQMQVPMYELYADYSTKVHKYKEQHICKCINENNAKLIQAILEKELFSVPCYKPLDDEDMQEMTTMHMTVDDIIKMAEFESNSSQQTIQPPEKPKRIRKTTARKTSELKGDVK